MRPYFLLIFIGTFLLSAGMAVAVAAFAATGVQTGPERNSGEPKMTHPPAAEEQPALFPPYLFGMRRERAASLPGAATKENGDILLPEAAFAGLPWTVRLEFRDERLVRVSLMEIYTGRRLEAVNAALRDMGFEMLAMLVDKRRIDFISVLKTEGSAALQKNIAALHETKNPSRVGYAWFDTKNIRRETKIMARNLSELLQIIAADTREAEVTALGDGKGGLTHLLVDFTLPILELQTFH